MDFDDNASEVTISGLLMATEWNDDDDVTDLEISSDDDGYYVEKNAMWYELVDLWDTHVEVTGIVTEERDGSKRILVTNYEPLEDVIYNDEDIEYDDMYDELSFENDVDEARM